MWTRLMLATRSPAKLQSYCGPHLFPAAQAACNVAEAAEWPEWRDGQDRHLHNSQGLHLMLAAS